MAETRCLYIVSSIYKPGYHFNVLLSLEGVIKTRAYFMRAFIKDRLTR